MSEIFEVSTNVDTISTMEHPMVVFLRGDEHDFNDFCMNAEEVMQVLGIRRSRLNQISGKELRVGRTRINNYVRPVYRKQDVEEYLKWMRPTATHKKSSDLLNEARSKLEQQSDKLSEQLATRFETMIEMFTSQFKNEFFDQRHFSKSMLSLMQKSLRIGMRTLLQRSSFQEKQALAYWEDLKQGFADIQALKRETEELKIALVQLNDLSKYSELLLLNMQTHQKDLQERVDAISGVLDELRHPIEVPDLPLVRQRRGSSTYTRVRKFTQKNLIISELKSKNQAILRPWRRKKVAIKTPT